MSEGSHRSSGPEDKAPMPGESPTTKPRRWRIRLGIPAAITLAVFVGVLLVASTGSGPTHTRRDNTVSKLGAIEYQEDIVINALLRGIPQHGNTLGQPTAPVTLQFYGDLECFTSKVFAVSFLPSIIHDLVRNDNLKIEFHSLETDTHNPKTFVKQQMAALAAGQQNKLWNFILTFYHEQGQEYTSYVTEKYLNHIASQTPSLQLEQWDTDRENHQLFTQLISDRSTALSWHKHITPTFFIGRTGGKMERLPGYEIKQAPGSLVDALYIKEAIEKLS